MMLSEEGPVSYFDNYALGIHYDQNLNKIVDEFFFWGKNDLFKLPKKIFSKKINIFGHPKFDLLNQNNGIFFNEKSEILKKKYGNFILFSSSFERPISKSMLLSRYLSYYKNLSKDKILNLCNKEFRDLSENQKNFKEVIKLLFEIAKKFPKVKVIFRKHPNQKYSDFIELLKINQVI
jgi:surface carbohydrate biosynthesis protein